MFQKFHSTTTIEVYPSIYPLWGVYPIVGLAADVREKHVAPLVLGRPDTALGKRVVPPGATLGPTF